MVKPGDVFQVRGNGNNYCAVGSIKNKQKKKSSKRMIIATKNGSIKLNGHPINGKYNLYLFSEDSVKRVHDRRKVRVSAIKKKLKRAQR